MSYRPDPFAEEARARNAERMARERRLEGLAQTGHDVSVFRDVTRDPFDGNKPSRPDAVMRGIITDARRGESDPMPAFAPASPAPGRHAGADEWAAAYDGHAAPGSALRKLGMTEDEFLADNRYALRMAEIGPDGDMTFRTARGGTVTRSADEIYAAFDDEPDLDSDRVEPRP